MQIRVETKVPAGMNTKDAWEYVGGRRAFELLREQFPTIVRPAIQKGKLTIWRRESLEMALEMGETAMEMVEPGGD